MGQIVKGRQFVAPGPGSWELDAVHMPRPMTLFAAEVMEKEFGRGFAEGSAKFGVMLDHLEGKAIHHFWYHTPRPVGAPKNASGPPPKFIFKLMVMLHPAIRRRLKASKAGTGNTGLARGPEGMGRDVEATRYPRKPGDSASGPDDAGQRGTGRPPGKVPAERR